MLCPLCSKENQDGARFCGNCGGSLSAASSSLDEIIGPGTSGAGDGLEELFQSLSSRKPVPDQPRSRPEGAGETARRLSIDDIISSAGDEPVNPPSSIEEASARPPAAAQSPGRGYGGSPGPLPTRPPGSTPHQGAAPEAASGPAPRKIGLRRDRAEGTAPEQEVRQPAVARGPGFAARIAAMGARSSRALTILACLGLLGVLGELGRHIAASSVIVTGSVGGAVALSLVFALAAPNAVGSREVAKVVLLGIVLMSLHAHRNAATLSEAVVFADLPAPVFLNGALLLVFLFATLSLLVCPWLPVPFRALGTLLGLYSTLTLGEALAGRRPFDDVLAGKGMAEALAESSAYLEPFWLGMNVLLVLALAAAFLAAMAAIQRGERGEALSLALSVAILALAGRFGILTLESSGRSGLPSALARVNQSLSELAASRGLEIPAIIPWSAPGATPVETPGEAPREAPREAPGEAPERAPGEAPARPAEAGAEEALSPP